MNTATIEMLQKEAQKFVKQSEAYIRRSELGFKTSDDDKRMKKSIDSLEVAMIKLRQSDATVDDLRKAAKL